MREPVVACVGLGANLGDAQATIERAIEALARLPDSTLTARSSLWRTAPWQAQGPDFINAVAALSTRLSAPELLQALQSLELAERRERPYPNAPRTLDLDVLLYGDARIESPTLVVPHPRMHQRAFVLAPLREIAPGRVDAAQWAAVADQRNERC